MFLGLNNSQWIDLMVSVLILVGGVLSARLLTSLLLAKGGRWLVLRTRTRVDEIVLDAVRPPLFWLIVIIGLQIAVERITFVPFLADERWKDVFFVLYLVVVFALVWRLTSRLFKWYGGQIAQHTDTQLDEQLVPFFRRLALIVLTLVTLTVVLGHFDVNISAFVTTLGIGSLAFALAAQATLADTISGFVIMIDRPFRIGDRIEIQELNTWGDVMDIGLRSSRIRTRDNRMVVIPNSVIGKSLIVNHSYPNTEYRIEVHVGVAYGTDLELARETMIEAVQNVEGVLSHQPVEALFLEFGDSALIFRVRWWIESYIDTRRMFDRVNTALYRALTEAGLEIPFPQRMVHVSHAIQAGSSATT
jgi:MscS family membrane protein